MPKKVKPARRRALYKSPPPRRVIRDTGQVTRTPQSEFRNPQFIAPSHFELREDGTIGFPAPHPDPLPQGEGTAKSTLRKSESGLHRRPTADNSPSPGNPSLAGVGEGGRRPGEGRGGKTLQCGEGRGEGGPSVPKLIFSDPSRSLWLYHGNCLELLDAIAAKYPEGRFDAIFADPPT